MCEEEQYNECFLRFVDELEKVTRTHFRDGGKVAQSHWRGDRWSVDTLWNAGEGADFEAHVYLTVNYFTENEEEDENE